MKTKTLENDMRFYISEAFTWWENWIEFIEQFHGAISTGNWKLEIGDTIAIL